MTPRAAFAAALLVLLASLASAQPQRRPRGTPTPAPPAPALSPDEEVYQLGRDALARGAFGAALRIFRSLSDDPRRAADPRFAFNMAQAARYAGEAGDAFLGYTRYLDLAPTAGDAAAVREQLSALVRQSPGAVLRALVARSRQAFRERLLDRELEEAFSQCPRVRLLARFRAREAMTGSEREILQTTYAFGGRAVSWQGGGSSPWVAWIVPTAPLAPPEELGFPPHLSLPAGEAFPLEMGSDLVSAEAGFAPPPLRHVAPPEPGGSVLVRAEVDRMGPPLFLAAARPGAELAEVRSGPGEPTVLLGKRRRDVPVAATPLLLGPRPSRAESKSYPGVPVLVVVLPDRDGVLERWAAPAEAFDVVNRFSRGPSGGAFYARADGTGPSLPAAGAPAR